MNARRLLLGCIALALQLGISPSAIGEFQLADTPNAIDSSEVFEPIEAVGEVIGVVSEMRDPADESVPTDGDEAGVQAVRVQVISGDSAGQTFDLIHVLPEHPAYSVPVAAGDKVLLGIGTGAGAGQEDATDVHIDDRYRAPTLLLLLSTFVLLILLFGGLTGLRSLLSLVFTFVLIIYLLIPLLLKGYSPLLLTIATCILATVVTMTAIGGINRKSFAAIIGTAGGVVAAGALAHLSIRLAPLTGFPDHEAMSLWFEFPELDFRGILASGMIIGALGASMDVAISIASSIAEVKKAHPGALPVSLIRSGMNVGKDIMGTMTNTLLLAYTGSAIFLLLLVWGQVSPLRLTNLDSIASEIATALVGSIGLILCIPITAVAAGVLIGRSESPKR